MTTSAQSASLKAAILTAIALALLLPLTLLSSLVAERVNQRDAAIKSVARGWGDRQWLAGPTSESYALLAGSLPLFALLSTVMLLTRKLDWYAPDFRSQT
jgi:inner membrane protein involved in colicin E2 resistance